MIFLFLGTISILTQITDAYVLLQVRRQDENHSNIDALIHKTVPSDKFTEFVKKMGQKQLPITDNEVKIELVSKEDGGQGKQNGGKSRNQKKNKNNVISMKVGRENDIDFEKIMLMGLKDMSIKESKYSNADNEYKREKGDKHKGKREILDNQSDTENTGSKKEEYEKNNKRQIDKSTRKGNQDYSIINNLPFSLKIGKNDLVKMLDAGIKILSKGKPYLRSVADYQPKTIQFRSGESSVLYEINSKSVINAMNDILSSKTVQDYVDTLAHKAAVVYRSLNNK